MPATEMYDHLVAKFDRGTAFPLEIGFPTVVSPASSDWLGQINLETGREVFQLDHLRPIVRTPVVVAAPRGTAECLGWPKRPVGWADLIALEDKPEVWAACPAAGSDWGPPLTLGDPATSPTARSALQALHLVGAGKLAEEFSLIDVEGSWVEELASRVRAASQPLALGSGGFPRDRNLSLVSGHFQPVEEYQVAQYYLGRSEATDGPDSEPDSEIVAIYPREGTMWHDNPYGIVNATWVSQEHREAALLVQQHLRSREEQDRFMEDGFRPGIYLEPREVLTPTRGLNLKQPQTFLGRLSPEVARAIQISWEAEISR
jgi:Ca-activated chloride channel family protein